jgi:hypothetical protein
MTNREPTPADVALVAIDISKLRKDVFIEVPGSAPNGGRSIDVCCIRTSKGNLLQRMNFFLARL